MKNLNDILWVPLDLPSVPEDLKLENISYTFVPDLDKDKKQQLRDQRKHHLYVWNSFRLRIPRDNVEQPYDEQVSDVDWIWTEEALSICPALIDYIETYLPFKKLKYVAAISSRGEVPMHFDHKENISEIEKQFYKSNDPYYYRLLLDGTINDNTFYVYTKTLGKKYCKLPDNSPGWAMGSYSCAHGNDEPLSGQKLLLYVMGDIDTSRHLDLVERSYNKFREYAIVRDYAV
jgi:hypothetical protein